MSVSSYEKDGKTLWQIYINIRDKENPAIRKQKRVYGFETEKAALTEEKKLIKEITGKLVKRAALGHTWESVIDEWETMARSSPGLYQLNTILDHVSSLRRWTEAWLNRPASEVTKGDAREVFTCMEQAEKSIGYQNHVKHTINSVFKWGIERRLIPNVHESPVSGLTISSQKIEKVPEILNIEEIRTLLLSAKQLEHPWYPIWAMALLTGMRNGELHALLWSDVDLENRKITVSKSYQSRGKFVKCPKNGHWRTVPISDDLYGLLLELKSTSGSREHVLPRFWKWDDGAQAEVLRTFCVGIGIRFHALRACFATQLLAHDVAPARIMKICGWSELKTMQHYVRLAGVDERGATEVLKVMPDDLSASSVINLFNHTKKTNV